jgi:pimeloyl-ACP methyl ester carboxylesterase
VCKMLCRTLQLAALAAFLLGTLPAKTQEPVVQSSDFFVTTSDNISIHVHRKIGAHPAKIPVLLIHGSWCDGRVWDFPGRSVMDYLAVRGYDVYTLDMRGMGQSVYSANYSTIVLETRLQDAIAVASYIVTNTGRAPVVMGWSQGGVITGMLASYAAVHAPQLVAGVGLFSVGEGPFTTPAPFQQPIQVLVNTAISNGTFKFPLTPSEYFAAVFGIDPITGMPTISSSAFTTYLTFTEPDAVFVILEEAGALPFFTTSPLAPAWARIQIPALVVDGALDLLVGTDHAQALFDALGSAKKQLIVFPRNSHAWFLEDNFAATHRVFNRFLAQFH